MGRSDRVKIGEFMMSSSIENEHQAAPVYSNQARFLTGRIVRKEYLQDEQNSA
jgi:hypothetical protein